MQDSRDKPSENGLVTSAKCWQPQPGEGIERSVPKLVSFWVLCVGACESCHQSHFLYLSLRELVGLGSDGSFVALVHAFLFSGILILKIDFIFIEIMTFILICANA